MSFYDRVKTSSATASGTGNITWTAASPQSQLPPTSINETVIYTVLDSAGSAWETGRATLAESGGTYTLTRGGSQTVTASSNGNSAVALTNSGYHTVFLAPDALGFNATIVASHTSVASSTASIEFDVTGWRGFVLDIENLTTDSDADWLELTFSTDDGSTYISTGYSSIELSTDGSTPGSASRSVAFFAIGAFQGNLAAERLDGTWDVMGLEDGYKPSFTGVSTFAAATGARYHKSHSGILDGNTSAINKIKLEYSTGDMASGRVTVTQKL